MFCLQNACKKDDEDGYRKKEADRDSGQERLANTKIWDTEIKGFGLFTGKTRKTFYYQKDVHGKTVRTKLGTWGEISTSDAKAEAALLVAQYASGAVAKRLRAARIPTLDEATVIYLARPKLRSEHNKVQVRSQMDNHLNNWLTTPLDEIEKADCVRAHARIAKTGERGANHVMKSFRSIYNHARRTHDLPESPTMAIEWFDEKPSQKIIADLAEWDEVVRELENPVHSAYYRFLLFTGLRMDEARSLRWDQIHDDHLHLPETKNGRAFNLPLMPEHHEILDPMRMYRSDPVDFR